MLKYVLKKLDNKINIQLLLKIMVVLIILFLIQETDQVWGSWIIALEKIFQPFLIGFVIAYILNPMIEYLQRYHISKKVATIVVLLASLSFFVILIMVLFPMLYDKILEFFNSLVYAIQWITDMITSYSELENIEIVNEVANTATQFIREYQSWLPELTNAIPSLFSSILSMVTTILFSIIIGVYMLIDFNNIKVHIKKEIHYIIKGADPYINEIDENVSVYIRSLFLLMVIKFFEYSLLYFLVGHNDWVIIGLLTAVGLIIPYFGATIANCIGILTALTLSPMRFIALIIGIVLLANIDSYVIGPLIHKKRSALGPLISIFAIFAGGIIANVVGITLAIPVVLALRSVIDVYNRDPKHAND